MNLSQTLNNLANDGNNDDSPENLATIDAWGNAVVRIYAVCESIGFNFDDLLILA